MPVAISVENLSKRYLISHQQKERYTALRDVVAGGVRAMGRRLRRSLSGNGFVTNNDPTKEEFWALKDLNFEIQQGDRVGIIGRNGAGKSTLLKILSRVTEPTSGRVSITGRVASLLEVGTGFHPELTGRENIYLNGAILGMSKAEIRLKFDEIVDFAEVERFLDTPVKHYSSGMHVRLAFAVAAHLEPEILLVDEVLAVGDAQFQRKCLGRMQTVSGKGRTVIFVSHNISAVSTLCNKGLVLRAGHLAFDSEIAEAVKEYVSGDSDLVFERNKDSLASGPRITKAWFAQDGDVVATQIWSGLPICVVVEGLNPEKGPLEVSLSFWDELRRPLWNFSHAMYGIPAFHGLSQFRARVTFQPPKLTVSELCCDIAIGPRGGGNYYDHIIGAFRCPITELPSDEYRARYPNWPILCDAALIVEGS